MGPGWKEGETNKVFLDGYICKEPTYRKTPLGREIADVLLAVNRPYGKLRNCLQITDASL